MRRGWLLNVFRGSAPQWFVRLRSGPITPGVDAKFRRWLAADPAHEVDYERHELAWELAGELAGDGEISALLAEAQSAVVSSERRHSRRHTLSWAAAAVVAVAVGAGIYTHWHLDGDVYTVGVGEQRTVVLPDHSRITLNTATRARVVFKRNVRVVELEYGEATFSVTHDAARPFEVHAAKGTARALGTQFNVLSTSQGTTVSVLSGKVAVIAPESAAHEEMKRSTVLVQGQEVSYDTARLLPVHAADAKRILAWHSGRIAFEDVPLEQAIAEFNRYTRTPIVLADRSLGALRVTGVFRIGETGALLRSLNTAFGIRAEHDAGAIQLRPGVRLKTGNII